MSPKEIDYYTYIWNNFLIYQLYLLHIEEGVIAAVVLEPKNDPQNSSPANMLAEAAPISALMVPCFVAIGMITQSYPFDDFAPSDP